MPVAGNRFTIPAAAFAALALAAPAAAGWLPAFGVEEGVSLGNLGRQDNLGRGRWTVGTSAGLVAAWSPSSAWALEFAPGWERAARRSRWAATYASPGLPPVTLSTDHALDFDRIQLPVRALVRPWGSSWVVEGGAGAAWLGRAVDRTKYRGPFFAASALASAPSHPGTPAARIFEDLYSTTSTDVTRLYHRWDGQLLAGVGWEHRVGGPRLRLRARWQQGLTRINKDAPDDVRLSGFSLTAGLLW